MPYSRLHNGSMQAPSPSLSNGTPEILLSITLVVQAEVLQGKASLSN